MNTTNIYIPQKIHVGYQNRDDTYTGKLAYVIYTDGKGKKHKEASFNNWRDNKIPVDDYDNVATDGFVLNRKVGGIEESWGHYARLSYVRVYDPRGFEFEISIQNLLWILQECNSIKGKGLEGEFVYGWDGKDLVLVPTCSAEYKAICDNTNKHIKSKDVVIGYTYEQKNGCKYVYLGRYDYYEISTEYNHNYYIGYKIIDQTTGLINYKYKVGGKYYWYAEIYGSSSSIYITATKTPKKFYRCVEEVINPRYNEMINKMKHDEHYSPINYDDTEIIDLPFENFCMALSNNKNYSICVYSKLNTRMLYLQIHRYDNLSITARDCVTLRYYYNYYSDEDFYTRDSNGVNKFDLAKLYNKIKPVYFVYKQINGNEYTRKGWYDKDGNKYVKQ